MLRRISSASTSTFSSLVRGSSNVSSLLETASEGLGDDVQSQTTTSTTSPSKGQGSSAAVDTGLPNLDALTLANQQLVASLETLQIVDRASFSQRLSLLAIIQHILTEERETRDTFREHGGFLNIISMLASLDERSLAAQDSAEGAEAGADSSEVRQEIRFELVKLVFAILSVSFLDNHKNRTTFLETVGFDAIGEAIKLSRLAESQSASAVDGDIDVQATEKLLSVLYAFLVADFAAPNVFAGIRTKLDGQAESSKSAADDGHRFDKIDAIIDESAEDRVRNPEVLSLLLDVQDRLGQDKQEAVELRYTVLGVLRRLVETSRANMAHLCNNELSTVLLTRIFEEREVATHAKEREACRRLLGLTLACGLSITQSRSLLKTAIKDTKIDTDVLRTIIDGVKASRLPSSVHFDLSSTGFASISLPSLGKPFPPPTHGYTFLAWIHISTPPSENETITLFGCSDESSRSFVEIALSSDANLTIASSANKTPVAFEAFTFDTNKWYQVAVVHQRPKYSTSSPVALYIDGKLVDTVKATFPSAPTKEANVSAWLGTPKERVTYNRLGKGKSAIQWDLGPCWLLHGDLTEDIVFLLHSLGPRYASNFQDRLGQFQTNASSSLINVRLDSGHRDVQDSPYKKSALAYAVRDKGSAVIPEHKIYFSFSALNTCHPSELPEDVASFASERVIINAAVADPKESTHRYATLGGDATVVRTKGLDISIWQSGGIAIVLRLVEVSDTSEELLDSLTLFVEYIRLSWRNSEDAERSQAYEILADLLKAKTTLINSDVHDLLFELAGYDFEDSTRSVVGNSLATRFILLDLSLWTSVNVDLQWAHFDRLREMIARSEHAAYNAKRLSKMHLSRKLLYSLRMRSFDDALESEAVTLLMTMLKAQFGTEAIRNIATWLTATLCADVSTKAAMPAVTSFVIDASTVPTSAADKAPLSVLKSLHDILLDPYYHRELDKFARVITTRWLLLFMLSPHAHPLAAVLAVRILTRLLQTQDHGFVTRFAHSADGFLVLRRAVSHHWYCAQVYAALFALLRDIDITTVPLDTSIEEVLTSEKARPQTEWSPEYMRCVVACLLRGAEWVDASHPETKETADEPKEITPQEGLTQVLSVFSRGLSADQTGGLTALLMEAVPLSELTHGLTPLLRLDCQSPANGTVADIPSLPVLSHKNGFAFSSALSPTASREGLSSSQRRGLAVDIPDLVIPSDDVFDTPPETPADDARADQPVTDETIEMLDILAQHVYQSITSRSSSQKRSLGLLDRQSFSPEGPLRVLHDVFDAAATQDRASQARFRTWLLRRVVKRSARAAITPLVLPRVATFLKAAVDHCLQGWCLEPLVVLEFALSYTERVVDITATDATGSDANNVKTLFSSLNRLVLFALTDAKLQLDDVLKLLVRHQMTLFSMLNSDADFFSCLVERLCFTIQTSEEQLQKATIDFFKLFLLQRPSEAEDALNEKRLHDSQARFVGKLIDAENDALVGMLASHQAELVELHQHWEAFVEYEVARLTPVLEEDIRNSEEQARTHFSRVDQARKRFRKHQKSYHEWASGIREVESTRMAHVPQTRQDIADHAIYIASEWQAALRALQSDRAIWEVPDPERTWRLDFTEGHCRMRKKLEIDESKKRAEDQQHAAARQHDKRMSVKRHDSMSFDRLQTEPSPSPMMSPASAEDDSIWRGDTFPAAEPVSRRDHDEMPEEDKNRKVRRSLEPGDVIEAVYNTNRIDGLDAFPCLLLFAKRNVYLVDGYFQRENGELVDAQDASPEERDQHLQTLADLAGRGSKRAQVVLLNDHRARQWAWSDLIECHERKYLFRNVALELFFADGRSFLLTFAKDQRAYAFDTISTRCPAAVAVGSLHVASASLGERVADVVMGQRTKLEYMSKRWERREVTTFEYLMFLNTCAGRTYNDVTNYPVFPWILADWTSEELDLTKESTFRDLTKPMGAQTEDRKREFEERFAQLAELDDGNAPWHYGSHYSSAMIVVGYLVRLKPFTEAYLDLQGGSFDHADRMFWSLSKAWDSASRQSRSDVRELIPEFFYLPDFLVNSNGLAFGRRQENDEAIDDVELPPWAKGSPRLFIEKHREALESEYVSRHLHAWIDLVFGFKQKGPAAVETTNVFQALSYEGAIDLDTIVDADERRAATSTIHNFGMTPRQLFARPHPARPAPLVPKGTLPLFSPDTRIEEQTAVMIESCVPVYSIPSEIALIYASTTIDKTVAVPRQTLLLPEDPNYTISWGYPDQSVRVHARGHSLPVSLFENLHSDTVTHATWADARTFVTASADTTVCLWRWRWKSAGRNGQLKQLACLRGHEGAITSLAASREFSVLVTGSNDKTAIVWDLNRHKLVHQLDGHDGNVGQIAISDTTGDIATCAGSTLRVWTINGELLATQSTSNFSDPITSVAWSLSETDPIIATGHRYGIIKLWKRQYRSSGSYELVLLQTLTSENPIEVTALAFSLKALFVGHSSGLVYTFAPPNGTDLYLPDSRAPACMVCGTKFGLVEGRRRCCACGKIACSLCSTTLVPAGGRFDVECVRKLSPSMVAE